ncbi:hypothetical protein [Bradyrhizobium oligotrophicum]|uniref:hypothetical protein n=1 Tax=Bradyrhizobium oligotrophicum TaxID=44255 RepID=UPI003EB6E4D9
MTPASVVIATIPPAFAILVEIFNPISEDLIRASMQRDLVRHGLGNNSQAVTDTVTKAACGAVEVSGLAPTLIAVFTSGFGIFHDYASLVLIMIYVLTLAAVVLVVIRFLGGQTFYEIEDTRQARVILGRTVTLPWSGSKAIGRLIFFLNGLLIALILIAYCALEHPWEPLLKALGFS